MPDPFEMLMEAEDQRTPAGRCYLCHAPFNVPNDEGYIARPTGSVPHRVCSLCKVFEERMDSRRVDELYRQSRDATYLNNLGKTMKETR